MLGSSFSDSNMRLFKKHISVNSLGRCSLYGFKVTSSLENHENAHINQSINQNCLIKGTVSRDFWPSVFHQTIPPGPLIHGPFWILLRMFEEIRCNWHHKHDIFFCYVLMKKTEGWQSRVTVPLRRSTVLYGRWRGKFIRKIHLFRTYTTMVFYI
jgi:hypothetical protein